MSKVAKAMASITANIAKLTERKNKLVADINALRDKRAALKATPAPVVAPKAKAAPKAAAPAKAKPAAKKAAAKK